VISNVSEREELAAWYEQITRLEGLVAIGEGKAAVDQIRRQVNAARVNPPADALTFVRTLSQYARILESMDALAEAEFIWTEALEAAVDARIENRDAVDAFLYYGLLLIKMHNYDGAVAKLDEALKRAERLEWSQEIDREITLARAWRGKAQAFEALGEFSQASGALDVLMNVKRQIRFIVFAASTEG